MVIAMLFDTLTFEDSEKKLIDRYPKAIQLAKNRNNLALWSSDEGIIGTVRGKWKISGDIEDEDNLAECYDKKVHQLKLGDFSTLGDFLQALIGDKQTTLDEK
jgi:hypothetical protein